MRLSHLAMSVLVSVATATACGDKQAPAPAPAPTPAAAPSPVPDPTTPKPPHKESWMVQPEDTQRTVSTLLARTDGSVIALGGSTEPGQMRIGMMAIDAAGKVLWDKTHGDRHSLATTPNGGGVTLPDGGFLVVGNLILADLSFHVWVGRFGADGSPMWEAKLGNADKWASANWALALANNEALVSVSRGDEAYPTHELVRISLADGSVTQTTVAPGMVVLPERDGKGVLRTLAWTYPGNSPTSQDFVVDPTSGELKAPEDAASVPSREWEKAAGDALLMASALLTDGSRILVTRGETVGTPSMIMKGDAEGKHLWTHFLDGHGFDQVSVITPVGAGFAFVAERWVNSAGEKREPRGVRIIRMD